MGTWCHLATPHSGLSPGTSRSSLSHSPPAPTWLGQALLAGGLPRTQQSVTGVAQSCSLRTEGGAWAALPCPALSPAHSLPAPPRPPPPRILCSRSPDPPASLGQALLAWTDCPAPHKPTKEALVPHLQALDPSVTVCVPLGTWPTGACESGEGDGSCPMDNALVPLQGRRAARVLGPRQCLVCTGQTGVDRRTVREGGTDG